MHGHDAHGFATLVQIALDLASGTFKPGQEAGDARHVASFIGQCPVSQFIEHIIGFVAEALAVGKASAFGTQNVSKKREGPFLAGDSGKFGKALRGGFDPCHSAMRMKRVGQRAGPPDCDLHQVVVVEPEQRALQRTGQRIIIVGHQARPH